MDNLNEQCYQLAFSWQTDTIETVVLFTLREMIINVMSVIILFEAARTWVEKHISPPEIYVGSVSRIWLRNKGVTLLIFT